MKKFLKNSFLKMDRKLGLEILSEIVKAEKNRELIEKNIYNLVKDENNDKYLSYIYQVFGMLFEEQKKAGSLQKDSIKNILKIIKDNKLDWNAPCYKKIADKIAEHDDYIVNPFEISEGVTVCSCGSNKTWSFQKQTRSSDEPMTTFTRCSNCGKQWSYSG